MEWPMVELGKVAKICGGATPRRENPAYWNGVIAGQPMPGVFVVREPMSVRQLRR